MRIYYTIARWHSPPLTSLIFHARLPCGGSPLNANIFRTPDDFAILNTCAICSRVKPVQLRCNSTSTHANPMFHLIIECTIQKI